MNDELTVAWLRILMPLGHVASCCGIDSAISRAHRVFIFSDHTGRHVPNCGHDKTGDVNLPAPWIDPDFVGDSVRLVAGGGSLEERRSWRKAHAAFARCKAPILRFRDSTKLHRVSEFPGYRPRAYAS